MQKKNVHAPSTEEVEQGHMIRRYRADEGDSYRYYWYVRLFPEDVTHRGFEKRVEAEKFANEVVRGCPAPKTTKPRVPFKPKYPGHFYKKGKK